MGRRQPQPPHHTDQRHHPRLRLGFLRPPRSSPTSAPSMVILQPGWKYHGLWFPERQQLRQPCRGQSTEVFWCRGRPLGRFTFMIWTATVPQQLILAGEGSQHGVFISAYHRIGYDIDRDGAVDVEAGGYAGNGSNCPLMLQDTTGNFTTSLNVLPPDCPIPPTAMAFKWQR